jgi:hypothetical protein
MHFHSPLDDVQRNLAVRQHAQMRANLQHLRRHFPPRGQRQRAALRAYRHAIQDFGRELLKRRDKINTDLLNALSDRVGVRFVEYLDGRLG